MPAQQEEPYKAVDSATANGMIDRGDVYVIDVREPREWNETGHIKGATLVPLNTFLKSPRQYLKGDNVLFYCAMGQRSAVASEMAAALGLEHIFNLEGGITDWIEKKLPVER